jgi:exocyst complex protein 7
MRKNSSFADLLSSEDGDGDQELEKYLVLLLGLQKLLVWERHLLNDIIPSSRHSDVFSRLAHSSIDSVVRDAEQITNRVLRNISRKEWASALGVFSALKHVQILQPEIDRICDTNQREQLGNILRKFQQTGAKALEQFLDSVRNDGGGMVSMSSSTLSYSGSNVPKDATVYELTSNTIWFLEHLQEHSDTIGDILRSDLEYTKPLDLVPQQKLRSNEYRFKAILGIYIRKVLTELNLTIQTKAEQYNDLASKHLFKLNNTHYILKSLQRSSMIDLVSITEHECQRKYETKIYTLKKDYMGSWSKLLASIALDELPKPVNGKIKDKERAIIKERFSTFNKELDEAARIQRGISIPDVVLREGIKRDNIEHIIPLYNPFFEK